MSAVSTQFYTVTKDAWDIMLDDIRQAKKTIDIEQYIFTIDSIGVKFVELLREKAREGIQIRLICDMVGSFGFYRSVIPELLKSVGIQIKFFNPISPWRITHFSSNFFRDHRKLMIIDETVGHIGGVGIQEHMAPWRDTHLRITGPLVDDLHNNFEVVWKAAGKKWKYIRFPKPERFIKNFNLVINSPGLGQRHIYHELISNIRNAKHFIYITTPYFIPDVILFRVLRLAAKRGVDVRLLMPQISDHIFVNHAREAYFTLALKAGIKILIYQPEMMHAKTAIIDTWATAGSFNLDSLSFVFNHEANISSTDKMFVDELKKHFSDDSLQTRAIVYEEWIRRPWRKKFLELLTWPFHGIM